MDVVKGGGTVLFGMVGRKEGDLVERGVVGDEVVHVKQTYIPKYRSTEHDLMGATKGLVETVLNGDAIPVHQRRIFYAGFDTLEIIPLGDDKVFLRTTDDGEVSFLLSQVAEFFNNFFTSPVRWNKGIVNRERGAWVRIYGTPLHAWNINFFKFCVLDCGRLLQADEFTFEKQRLDYARVLVATSSLEVINLMSKIVVDEAIIELKIIEERGFSLGEDTCLDMEDNETEGDQLDTADLHDDVEGKEEAEALINHLSREWNKEDCADHHCCSAGATV